MTRRDFLKAVVGAAITQVAVGGSPAFTVNRRNMWFFDATSDEALVRCNGILAENPNDVLALVHRGQVPCIYFDQTRASADLSKAISLEAHNPCIWYIRGVCFDRAESLQYAISLLSEGGDIGGKAICSSTPDYFRWQGTESGELLYMAHRDLGYALEQDGRFHESIAAYKKAGEVESILFDDLETWAEASIAVESYCQAIVQYARLIAIEPRAEFMRRRKECWVRMRVNANVTRKANLGPTM